MGNLVQNVNVDKIKDLAKEQGITMKYFCDSFGKRHNYLSEVRSGKSHLDENELKFIVNKLNTTIEYLTDKTEQKEKPVTEDDEREKYLNNIGGFLDTLSNENLVKVMKMFDSVSSGEQSIEKLYDLLEILKKN